MSERGAFYSNHGLIIRLCHVILDAGDGKLGGGPCQCSPLPASLPWFRLISCIGPVCLTKAAMSHQTGIQGTSFLFFSVAYADLPCPFCQLGVHLFFTPSSRHQEEAVAKES